MFDGVVLAGGRSSRMGSDKAGLPWRGQPLWEHMRDLLRQAGAARVLVSGPYPEPDGLPDRQPGLGPLGALLTLAQTQADGVYLLVPVDMPLLTVALIERLAAAAPHRAGESACVGYAGHVLPLCLRLDEATRITIRAVGGEPQRSRSLRALHAALGGATLPLADCDARALANCNTPEEWREVAK